MIGGIEVGDLKNTGLSRNLNNTITIAADILSNEGIVIDFTPRQIPTIVTELVGISQGMVEEENKISVLPYPQTNWMLYLTVPMDYGSNA